MDKSYSQAFTEAFRQDMFYRQLRWQLSYELYDFLVKEIDKKMYNITNWRVNNPVHNRLRETFK